MKGKIIFILLLLLMLCFQNLFAENNLIDVSVNKREVVLGNSITLTVKIDSSLVNDYKLPNMPDFIIEQNKSVSKDSQHIYTYKLYPKNIGYFDIPEIKINDNSSKLISIKVIEPDLYKVKTKKYTKGNDDIFVRAGTDVYSLYVNQLLIYNFEFYSKFELASNPSYVLPMFQDFWKSKPKIKSRYKLINGENYFTFTISVQLYPMKEGEIVIDPSTVSVVSLENDDREIGNFKKVNRNLKTEPVKIKVYPLPETGKPDNFSGAVGEYKITSYLEKQSFMVKEPISLYVSITGNGNINSIAEPEINLNENVQKYATTYKIKNDGWQSTKTFKYVLIPLTDGQVIIPPIMFSYFSPDSKSYITIKTNKINLNIKSGEYIKKDGNNISFTNNDAEEIPEQNIDRIREIKTNIKLKNYTLNLINNKICLLIVIILFLIILISSLIYRLRIIYINKDKNKLKRKKSYIQAIEYLKESEMCLSLNKQDKFYFSINLAVRFYLQSRQNVDYVNMLKEDLKSNLKKNKIEGNIIDNVEKILTDCELFKFTTLKSTEECMNQIYNNVKNIMKQLDNFYEKNNN